MAMAWDRIRRFTIAAACGACSIGLLPGCITYHAAGQPYSGTGWWLRNAARPWHCFHAAPNEASALGIGVPYTALVTPFTAVTAIGETLMLPVDHYFGVPNLPLPAEPTCEAFWGKPPTAPIQETPPVELPSS